MAQTYAGTALYRLRDFGWAETWYFSGESYVEPMNQTQLINTSRLDLACPDVVCVRVRVSNVAIRGDVVLASPTTPIGTFGASDTTSLQPTTVFQLTHQSGPLYTSHRPFRAMPLGYVSFATWSAPVGWLDNFASYKTTLNVAAMFKVKSKTIPIGSITYVPVLSTLADYKLRERKCGRPFGLSVGRRRRPVAP